MSSAVDNTEKDQHNIDEGTTSIGLKDSRDSETDLDNLDDGIFTILSTRYSFVCLCISGLTHRP